MAAAAARTPANAMTPGTIKTITVACITVAAEVERRLA
jgi:hypothetical protein